MNPKFLYVSYPTYLKKTSPLTANIWLSMSMVWSAFRISGAKYSKKTGFQIFWEGPKIWKENSNYSTFFEYPNFKVIDSSLFKIIFLGVCMVHIQVFSVDTKIGEKSKKIPWEKNRDERWGFPTIRYIYILQFHTFLAP